MFRSHHRDHILAQFEHSLFSGLLAMHWGNARFDRPALDFERFARGVALHDWHYGPLDNHPLGDYDHAEWQAIVERGVVMHYDDPITDAVAKRHLRRLIGTPETQDIQTLLDRLNERIAERRAQTPYSDADFEWADRITRFCDTVAFNLGFENLGWHKASVHARRDDDSETEIAYQITSEGTLRFEPWPFSLPEFGMPLTRYESSGYPDRLQPIVTFVRCIAAEEAGAAE
ncbi:DUF3891 family protein [Salinisphaera hydrothermalis]|uniref:DUF3891 family protein n=1 Tax=Salinisphaera hydrothermalis TaxID=563188 RepID=UPI00333ED747